MADPNETGAVETCRIVLWRGYVKYAFYAVPERGEPVGSPFFRSGEGAPVQSGSALEAHGALLERLAAEGWEPAARGRAWYALTLRRCGWSAVEELPLEKAPVAVPGVEAHAAPTPPPAEPEPMPAVEPEPVPAPAARTSRQPRALIVITAALIALAVVLGLALFGTSSAQGKHRGHVSPAQARQELLAQRGKPAVSAAHRPLQAVPTRIVVNGSRGDSWVEARVGSKTGRSLFAGVVAKGQTVRVTAPVVWITFGAAGNLDLRVNGRAPVPGTFNGTITAVIAHGQVRAA
jgi:hypothetical protein